MLAADLDITRPDRFYEALDVHWMVDLLEAADGRVVPGKVLADSWADWDLRLEQMIRVVEARAARAADPERLLGIGRKLEGALRQFKERYGGP